MVRIRWGADSKGLKGGSKLPLLNNNKEEVSLTSGSSVGAEASNAGREPNQEQPYVGTGGAWEEHDLPKLCEVGNVSAHYFS